MIIGTRDIDDIVKDLSFKVDEQNKTVSVEIGRKYSYDTLDKDRLRVKQYEVVLGMADLLGILPEPNKISL